MGILGVNGHNDGLIQTNHARQFDQLVILWLHNSSVVFPISINLIEKINKHGLVLIVIFIHLLEELIKNIDCFGRVTRESSFA